MLNRIPGFAKRIGSAATKSVAFFLQAANNLSDLASASTARTNLGLGTAATQNTGTSGANVPLLNGANTWSGVGTQAALLDVQQDFRLSGDITPAQIIATQNDYNPTGLSTASVLRLTVDAARDVTGLQGGADGRIVCVLNADATNSITLKNENASSTAANRFAIGADLVISANNGAVLIYDSTSSRWRLFGGAGSGAGGGAATSEAFVTIGNSAGLSAERSLTAGTGVTLTDAGVNSTVTMAVNQAFTPTWTGAHTWNGANITLTAGSTSVAPISFQSGTNLTTPTAGVFEYDGKVHYSTHAANERGVINSEQWISNTSTRTLASQTAAQAIFNSPANGTITVAANTTYQWECEFDLTAMSAVSGTFGFAIGGTATLSSIKWWGLAAKSVLGTRLGGSNISYIMNATASNTTLTTADTTTTGSALFRGVLRVTTGGTIIPQVSQVTAAAAIVGVNSFFRIWPVGSDTAVSLGNWS